MLNQERMLCVAFGLLNGMILCALIFSLPALQQLHPTGLLAEYQTLAAGLLAFVGAGSTTVYLIIRAGSDDRRKRPLPSQQQRCTTT